MFIASHLKLENGDLRDTEYTKSGREEGCYNLPNPKLFFGRREWKNWTFCGLFGRPGMMKRIGSGNLAPSLFKKKDEKKTIKEQTKRTVLKNVVFRKRKTKKTKLCLLLVKYIDNITMRRAIGVPPGKNKGGEEEAPPPTRRHGIGPARSGPRF